MAAPPIVKLLREVVPTVSVGILAADLMALGSEVGVLERAGVRLAHVDVMDGCFCPMMTIGPPVIKALKTPMLKDVHLMIRDPLDKVAEFVAAGADIVAIHPEAGTHIHRALQQMRNMANANEPSRGVARGVALNPGTPLETLEPLLDEVELVSLLAVNPGWKAQEFAPATWRRIEKAQQMIRASGQDVLLAVDGGITRENIGDVAATGVDVIVTGSAVFDGKAAADNAAFMLEAARSHSR